MITRDEFLAHRAGQFARLDRNDDGVLDAADRPARRSGYRLFDRIAAAMDTNGDGRTTRQEFTTAPTPIFDRADQDGNDVVDPYELTHLPVK